MIKLNIMSLFPSSSLDSLHLAPLFVAYMFWKFSLTNNK